LPDFSQLGENDLAAIAVRILHEEEYRQAGSSFKALASLKEEFQEFCIQLRMQKAESKINNSCGDTDGRKSGFCRRDASLTAG
jgi:hypothetical protein